MTREEFLQGLQNALSGEVPPEIVRDNLHYYDGYIREERKNGRGEQEILDELGDPRLIARTIIDTTPGAGNGGFADSFAGSYQDETVDSSGQGSYQSGNIHYYNLNKWYWKLLGIVIVIAIITLVIAVVSGILSLLVPMLPVLLMVALIMWFVRGPR